MRLSLGTRVAVTLCGWLVAAFGVVLVLGGFDPETYFLVSFVGLLGTMVLFAPTGDPPEWWRPLQAASLLCFLVFCYIVYLRFRAIT